ncbi:DUF4926 domain-containing protein [Bradyrhizobium sp. AZCC 1699]
MTSKDKNEGPSLLDVVALLSDIPAQQLTRGQVGTVVELLDDSTSLVEFSDEQGQAYAVVPCPRAELPSDYFTRSSPPPSAWSCSAAGFSLAAGPGCRPCARAAVAD